MSGLQPVQQPSPPATKRTSWLPKIRKDVLAIIVAGMAMSGTITNAVITVVNADAPSATCIEIYHGYQFQIEHSYSKAQREAVKSVMTKDPQAKYCKPHARKFTLLTASGS